MSNYKYQNMKLTVKEALEQGYKYCSLPHETTLEPIDGIEPHLFKELPEGEKIFLAEKEAMCFTTEEGDELQYGITEIELIA